MIYKRLFLRRVVVAECRRRCSGEASVVTRVERGLGLVTLNRPRALNSLDLDMIRILGPVLRSWEAADSGVRAVMVRGAGGKAFCAGGDIRAITEVPGGDMQKTFFREEYQLDHLVGRLSIPYIAVMNGITMGGGVGISVNGRFRVATERTVFAMPETAIGLVPDVGGGFFLPRLAGRLGMFLGLTGHRLKGWDCLKAGIATHAASEDGVEQLQAELVKLTSRGDRVSEEEVQSVLDQVNCSEAENHTFSLDPNMQDINRIFGAGSVEEIVSLLQKEESQFATKALKSIQAASPTSLKVAFRQIRAGAELASLAEVLKMEQRLVLRCCEDEDFYEGVRATLIDRDNKPSWRPPTLEAVSEERLDHYFSNLGPLELQL